MRIEQDPMTQLVKETVTEVGLAPFEINTGNCDEFADKLVRKARKIGLNTRLIVNDRIGHIWTTCLGKHYDAETPDGVANWKELPTVARMNKEVTNENTK